MSRKCRLIVLACIALLGIAEFHFKSAAADPNAQTHPPAVAAEPTGVEQAFEKRITVHFKGAPLKEVAEKLGGLMGINVMLDSNALDDAGIRDDTPVTFDVAGGRAGPAVRALLRKHDLGYEIRDRNVLLITTAEADKNAVVVRAYNVADLTGPPAAPDELPAPEAQDAASDVKDLIMTLLEPTSWAENGFSQTIGSIAVVGETLMISHNIEMHREVAGLLTALHLARNPSLPASKTVPLFVGSSSVEKEIRNRLDRRGDYGFHEIKLPDLIDYLRAQGLSASVDEKRLDDIGVSLDVSLTLKAKQVPLKFALRTMLKERELGYIIRDDSLVVTSDTAAKEYEQLVVYPVADLLDAGPGDERRDRDYDSLLDAITSMIAPTSWPDGTGPGPIKLWTQPVVLIISQTEEIHEQIADLLAQLRKARSAAVTPAAAEKKSAKTQDAMLVRIYHVAKNDKESLDEYISAIRKTIEPQSWESCYIGKVPGGIIVRNTRAVQAKVARLIAEIDRTAAPGQTGGAHFDASRGCRVWVMAEGSQGAFTSFPGLNRELCAWTCHARVEPARWRSALLTPRCDFPARPRLELRQGGCPKSARSTRGGRRR